MRQSYRSRLFGRGAKRVRSPRTRTKAKSVTGPKGNLFVVSTSNGAVYEIYRR